MDYSAHTPAVIFGMFETGLAVGRSLGSKGICVYGIDHKKDIGFYSKYIKADTAPHPIDEEASFRSYLETRSADYELKPALYITSDEYLEFALRNYDFLKNYFLLNIPVPEVLEKITDKYKLAVECGKAGVGVPESFLIKDVDEIDNIPEFSFPVILKANNVNKWRKKVGGSTKVRLINERKDLNGYITEYLNNGIEILLQEIIPGRDDKFFKYCTYRTDNGNILSEFMLQKLHQYPVNFGVGSLVKSCYDENLKREGRRLFDWLNFNGTGSAEFKYDERDGRFKLIEINPRYWQQNALADRCGINFPFTEYLYLTGQNVYPAITDYVKGIKWVNIYMDYSSYTDYRAQDGMSFLNWIDDLRGSRVYSDFSSDDVIPGFYEIFIRGKYKKLPAYMFGRKK